MPTPTKASNREITDHFLAISRSLRDAMYKMHDDLHSFTILQMRTLMYLHEHPGIAMGDLAAEFKITKASANSLAKRLIARDCVVRTIDKQDARRVRLTLTRPAAQAITKAVQHKQKIVEHFLSSLNNQDKQVLLHILRKLKIQHSSS